jgi:hypothetical protein
LVLPHRWMHGFLPLSLTCQHLSFLGSASNGVGATE